MLGKSEDYLKSACDETLKTVFIFTDDQFRTSTLINERFNHIFIDESHDLEPSRLVDILEKNMTTEKNINRHFWVSRDACQNKKGGAVIFPDRNISSLWNTDEEYFFTSYCLRYVFRSTQSQFLSLLPFMETVYCTYCEEKQKVLAKPKRQQKLVCDYCQPWHGVDTLGPEPLELQWLTSDIWPSNIAEIV